MKIGIVGLSQSGKTSLFNALTGAEIDTAAFSGKEEAHQAVVHVPDERVEKLNDIYKPKKKTPATIEYIDLAGITAGQQKKGGFSDYFLSQIRLVDAVLVTLRAFTDSNIIHPMESVDAKRDLDFIESEFILADLAIIENRMDRLQRQMKNKKNDQDVREYEVLEKLKAALEEETPIRLVELSDQEEFITRGFRFLSQKPLIIVVNIDDTDIANEAEVLKPFADNLAQDKTIGLTISAQIEMEIQQLDEEEATVFQENMGITDSARDRLIRYSYELLGLISFFTVGEDEVRAWTIPNGTLAPVAAGAIHSDIERGFIRAELVAYDNFMENNGSMVECKKAGVQRLEGKEYVVKDGDIINFRFAV